MHLLSRILSNREHRLFKDLLKALSLVLDLALDQKQQHSLRVAVACVQLGAEAGLPAAALRDLFYAGLLHDIGEIGLLDEPQGPQNQHPAAGARIVSLIPSLGQAAEVIRHHQERFDGTGFPAKLHGEQIPLSAQILALCNAVDSIAYATGPLENSPAIPRELVLRALDSWKGSRFEPGLVSSYAGILRRGEAWDLSEFSEKHWKSLKLDIIDMSYLIDLEEINYLEVTLKVFATIIDTKHRYTQGHSQRVAEFARILARTLALSDEQERQIYYAGFLHDAGKVCVSRQVLDKPSKLSDLEWKMIADHPRNSRMIIEKISTLEVESEIAGYHHERFDGRGYPYGLKGTEIPIGSRIMAVTDSYDAMTSQRSYRISLSHTEAIEEILRCSGQMYDPKVAEVFCAIPAEILNEAARNTL
ncbi:MAG TPA: HD domain-containing phosphohydrolase [Chroococcales cyanobacterium]